MNVICSERAGHIISIPATGRIPVASRHVQLYTYWTWGLLCHLHECTDYGTHSVTQMYWLWYPLSDTSVPTMVPTQWHKCTDYGTHSVTYTNVPTLVPTQSPTRMYRRWYPLSNTNVPTMVPTQSPTRMYRIWYPLSHLHECPDYGTHSVTHTTYQLCGPFSLP